MGNNCYRVGHETGSWFEIKCVADTIRLKEAAGKDAKFEGELLSSWAKYLGYKEAAKALEALNCNADHVGEPVTEMLPDENLPPPTGDAPEIDVSTIMKQKHPGRPQKEGEVSRVTAWRREKQGVLI